MKRKPRTGDTVYVRMNNSNVRTVVIEKLIDNTIISKDIPLTMWTWQTVYDNEKDAIIESCNILDKKITKEFNSMHRKQVLREELYKRLNEL